MITMPKFRAPSCSFRFVSRSILCALAVAFHAACSRAFADAPKIAELQRQLQDRNAEARRGAAWMLGSMGEGAGDAVPNLIAATSDENHWVQTQALIALVRIGSADSERTVDSRLPDILEFLRSQLHEAHTSGEALALIRQLGRRAAPLEGDLLSLLASPGAADKEKVMAALAEIGTPRAKQALFDLAKNDAGETGEAAAMAVARFGKEALPDLKALLESSAAESRYRAALALASMGDLAAPQADTLLGALSDSDPRVRIYAARALGNVKFEKALERLTRMAFPPDGQVSFEAAEAAGRIGGEKGSATFERFREEARPLLLEKIQAGGSERAWAIDEAARLKLFDADTIAAIEKAFQDKARENRKAAVEALALTRDLAHADLFLQGLADPDVKVRFAASRALAGLGSAAVPSLIAGLAPDKDRLARHMAILTLEQLGGVAAPAVGPLTKASEDPDKLISLAAKAALTRIGEAGRLAAPAEP